MGGRGRLFFPTLILLRLRAVVEPILIRADVLESCRFRCAVRRLYPHRGHTSLSPRISSYYIDKSSTPK